MVKAAFAVNDETVKLGAVAQITKNRRYDTEEKDDEDPFTYDVVFGNPYQNVKVSTGIEKMSTSLSFSTPNICHFIEWTLPNEYAQTK